MSPPPSRSRISANGIHSKRVLTRLNELKILYFDIDGSILRDSRPKPALADGEFESAVRDAGFERLVCVSNVITIIQFLESQGEAPNGHKMVFDICRGTIQNEVWFRSITTLASDPQHRARHIDLASDWWYLDDMAKWFLEQDGFDELFEENLGHRVFTPDESGDGNRVLEWLQTVCR